MEWWDNLTAYQFGRGHPILRDVSLQISRQLQGHLTYFLPVGGFLMGCKATHEEKLSLVHDTMQQQSERGEQQF